MADADDRIQLAVDLLGSAAVARDEGHVGHALDRARRALAILEDECGAEHPDVANALLAIGGAHEDACDYPAAEAAYRRAASIMDRYHDAASDEAVLARLLVHAHTAVGQIERILCHLDVAHATLTATVATAEELLGPDDPDTGTALNALGIVCKYAGRFEEGALHYRRALEITTANDGPDSLEAAAIWHNLGGLAFDAGDHAAALGPAHRAVDLHQRLLGPDHPTLAADVAALAAVLDALGRTEEAEAAYHRALDVLERAEGAEYDLAVLHNNLGVLAASRGNHAGALDHYRQALATKERLLGPDHADVAVSLHNLGVLATDLGDIELAVDALDRALTIFLARLGADHPRTVECRAALRSCAVVE